MAEEKQTKRISLDGIPVEMDQAVRAIAAERGVKPADVWREALYESPVFAGWKIPRVAIKLGGKRPGAGNKPKEKG